MTPDPMTLHDEAVSLLRSYDPAEVGQRAVREAMLAFLAARPDGMQRSCEPGHITASALVVDPTRDTMLLTLHRRIGAWLQLGGHCEPGDATVRDAALREAVEESGIAGLIIDPEPIDLDVHLVTCSLGIPTRHLDIRFLVTAPAGAEARISDESLDLAWFRYDAPPTPLGESVAELIDRATVRLAARDHRAGRRISAVID
jgi:8-oxo-dGTP pyrophosphatase MutT (NUDIX family)